MPKYSDTSVFEEAGCPVTGPLLVSTTCPTVQFVALSSKELTKLFALSAKLNKEETLIDDTEMRNGRRLFVKRNKPGRLKL